MNRVQLRRIANTSYPAVQLAMAPRYRGLSDTEIEAILAERFPGAAPEDVENFMKTLQKIGKVAAPIAQKALPGVIQGASAGMVAGPWGALAGGLAGGAASLLAGGGSKAQPARAAAPATLPPAPARPTPVTTPVRLQTRSTGPAPAALPVPVSPAAISPRPVRPPGHQDPAIDAAARLILLLSRPQIQQALLALLLGDVGRRSIAVQGRAVPVESFADAIAELAADLAEVAMGESATATAAEWITDADGVPLVDGSNPTERAALLFTNLITEAVPPLRVLRQVTAGVVDDTDDDSDEEDWDALEAYDTWMEDA